MQRLGVLLTLLLLEIVPGVHAQSADANSEVTANKLPLSAELVLSPEFCATKKRQSIALNDVLPVGRAACTILPTELSRVFSTLVHVGSVPAPTISPSLVVLIPKFAEVSATQPLLGTSQRELLIALEWTLQDATGKTIWLQTIQGSATRKAGWFTTQKGLIQLAESAVRDLAQSSIAKLLAAPELRNLSR